MFRFRQFKILLPSIYGFPFGIVMAVQLGNYDRLLNYTLITMSPWGRMGRDIFKVYNNPAYALDAFTGIPVHRLGQVEPERLPESPLAGPWESEAE